jgi:SAM-dependent methyltransferase
VSYDDVELSRLYDTQNPWGPGDAFYLALVERATDVLDVGCGTGTLLKRARRDGHRGRLVGLDPGRGMLAVARAAPGIEWVAGTLAAGTYDAEFDLVTMTGHAFQELRTDDEVRTVLRGMRDALRPGGTAAFETRDPAAKAWEEWQGASFAVEHEGATVRASYDVEAVEGELVTFTETTDGGRWDHDVVRGTLRFLPRDRLAAFVTGAGLTIEAGYGDWDGSPTGPEIITIATRPA